MTIMFLYMSDIPVVIYVRFINLLALCKLRWNLACYDCYDQM